MLDYCDKHGPYSTFCRACDQETLSPAMTVPEQAVENERAVNAAPLIEELRERTTLEYAYSSCQLIPKELIVRVINELEWLSRPAQPLMGVMHREDVAQSLAQSLHGMDLVELSKDERNALYEAADAVLALPHTGQPVEGWQLVPVDPDDAMLEAALEESGNRVASSPGEYESGHLFSPGLSEEEATDINGMLKSGFGDQYRAMLAAAPASPQPREGEAS